MLSLENTAAACRNLARQEIYFDRHFGLDETLPASSACRAPDVRRVAADLFSNGSLAARCSARRAEAAAHTAGPRIGL